MIPPASALSLIAAQLQIRELTAKYALFVDTSQVEPLVALFVEDGVFDETPCGLARYQGHVELATCYRQLFGVANATLHLTANHILDDLDGDEARGSCAAIIVGVIGGSEVLLTCRYDDVYVRTGGCWRFRSRTVTPYVPVDPTALASMSFD
ncbi:nuclear transport factor 2 family protein [Mycobacterium simiae]|uniref:nuclear transport factor 2 family protein n=1 Tax=Mycobacterium simiae TaxID=1784 RepID=UPI0026120757|nr:nuclear transport factor 2 family protein [Mycobacterium simiae]